MKGIPEVAAEFSRLLNRGEPEGTYQQFLERNPRLIPREFIQNHGLHLGLVLRKLSLARDYDTDFFYLAKSSQDWNCVLVEIEKPSSRLFKAGTSKEHTDFLRAIGQIQRWRAWFSNRSNFEGFVKGTLQMIRVPGWMAENPCFIKYVLVIGRRDECERNSRRRELIASYERDDFHILSFDSLLEDMHSKGELYVGVKHNDYVQIISDRFAGESLFSWVPPEQLRISRRLHTDILRHRGEWYHYVKFKKLMLDEVLPKVPLV